MFDISCLYGKPEFSTIQKDAFHDWEACPSFDPLKPGLVQEMKDHYGITEDGGYYFVEQNGALVPVWDLRSNGTYAGNPNAIVYAQKYKSIPSPDGPVNIDWVELKKLSGGLANVIYRVVTVQGQPPPTVSSSLNLSLSYLINVICLCSAAPALMQLSNIRRNTVRVHDLMMPGRYKPAYI
jgi:hypothetical protein